MKLLTNLFLSILILPACAPMAEPMTSPLSSPASQMYQDFSYAMVWSPDDVMIALTTNTGLYVYDTKTYEQLAAFDGLGGSTVVFSKEHLAAVNTKGIFVWSLADFGLVFTQAESTDTTHFQSVAISPDDKILVTAEQKRFRFWNLPEDELLAEIPSNNHVSDMIFSDTDTLLIADLFLGTIQEWNALSQKEIRAFGVSKPVVNFNLSQTGKIAVIDYGDYGFELWDVETGKAVRAYRDIIGAPGWNHLSGNNQIVVVWGHNIGNDSGLSVWDLSVYERILEISTPLINGDGWRCGALNSDGSILAASNNEGYIYFYNVQNGERVGEIFLPYKFTG